MKPFLRRGKTVLRTIGRSIKPYPLRTSSDNISNNPFFIVSSGRSGTTLLRAILNQHSELCIPPESNYLWRVIKDFKRHYQHLPWRDLVTIFCGEMACAQEYCGWDLKLKIFQYRARQLPKQQRTLAKLIDTYFQFYMESHMPEAVRWGDKTPHYLNYLPLFDSVFPQAQIIHIFRDGRDVAASYFKLGWAKTPQEACDQWLLKINHAFNYSQRTNNKKFMEIRYEDMVHDPARIIQQTCNFLQIEYRSAMLDFHLNPTKYRGDAIRPDLHPRLTQPINTKAIGKWRQVFTTEQQAIVQRRLESTLTAMGYELD